MKNILNKVLFKNKLKKLNPNYPLVLYEEEYKVLSKSGTYPFVKIGHHLTFVTKKKDKSTTIITENGYRDLNDDEKYLLITISDYFRIKRKIFWSDDSSPPNLEVEFLNKTVIFEYGVLTKSGIDLLVANGVAVNSRYIDMVLDYLFLSINNAPVHYKHKMLGFQEINGNIIYRHHKLISNSEKQFKVSMIQTTI